MVEHQSSNRLQSAAQNLKIGWTRLRQVGSHKKLSRPNFPNDTWSFGDGDELGPAMLNRIAKHAGLKPTEL